jgi:hypothetical protein
MLFTQSVCPVTTAAIYKATHVKNNCCAERVIIAIVQNNPGLSGGKINEKINLAVLLIDIGR